VLISEKLESSEVGVSEESEELRELDDAGKMSG
jgi:hypothetical protein